VRSVKVVVVVDTQGQSRETELPTEAFRQVSASVVVIASSPVGSHTQPQVCRPSAACRMNRQSVAVGIEPLLTGWAQGPEPVDSVVVVVLVVLVLTVVADATRPPARQATVTASAATSTIRIAEVGTVPVVAFERTPATDTLLIA
jgi:hypothetical protein